VPLTNKQRWHRYLSNLVSPGAVLESAAGAGIKQWSDTPSEWDQDGWGYGLRFASSFGVHVVKQSIESGTAALLHEDNRYVPCSETGFGPRLKYALTSTVMARSPNGSRRISISKISAFTATSFISRTWQPASTSQASDAFAHLGISVGLAAGYNVGREFLPRVFHFWGLGRK